MKNSIFLAVLSFMLVLSCKKDSLMESPLEQSHSTTVELDPGLAEVTARESLNDYALTTTGVTFSNGVLVFNNQQEFDNVMASLSELEASASFRTAFLATKGASALDPQSPDYVQNAGLQAFEERFSGFVSRRRYVQDSERTFLANGGEPENFEGGFIHSHNLQVVYNTAYEVKIGDIIYREIDEHNTFLVLSGSFNTLDYLRNLADVWEPNLPTDVLRLDERIKEHEAIGELFMSGVCNGIIGYNVAGVNSFSLQFFLFSAGGSIQTGYTVNWEIKNKNGLVIYTGANPIPGTTIVTGSLQNAIYPLTVTGTTTSTNSCNSVTVTKTIANGTPSCNFTVGFNENSSNLGEFDFYISSQPGCCGLTYTWSVDGGPTTTGSTFNFDSGAGDDDFVVTVVMTNPAGCTATQTITIDNSCGTTGKAQTTTVYIASSRRIRGKIWTDNTWFHSIFGTECRNFKMELDGDWVNEDADELKFVFSAGSKFTKGCNQYINLTTAPYIKSNSHKVQCLFEYGGGGPNNSKKVRIRDNEVTATFSVIEGGVSFPNILTITW